MELENSMRMMRNVFTGYYNGFNVEVRSAEEMALLYNMGCFGKGSASRSQPLTMQKDRNIDIMRKRQFVKRNDWYKKFGKEKAEIDSFLKEVDEVTATIIADGEKRNNKDVIDLVSSDENISDEDDTENNHKSFQTYNEEEMVVVVPNSDSEEDNYFAKMKPKCCYNKVKLQEKLMLTPEEAFFLVFGFGCLQIINMEEKILDIEESWELFTAADKKFIPKYVVYHYFRSKGYVVKPGIKFGGDYLIYKDGPEKTHAEYVVIVKEDDNSQIFDPIFMLGHMRMVHTTMKTLMIAEVKIPKQIVKMPEDLNKYSVQERLLHRFNPLGPNDLNENFNTFI